MSLIVTHISRFGILQLADSALTSGDRNLQDAGDADKLFEVPHLTAVLTVAGSYAVGAERLDKWLPAFIATNSAAADIRTFAENLRDALSAGITGTQAHIIHLAGYGRTPSPGTLPEFWHIRNFGGIEESTGTYVNRSAGYSLSEDFQSTNLPDSGGWSAFQGGAEFIYVNGLVYGRMAFNAAFQTLGAIDALLIQNSSAN